MNKIEEYIAKKDNWKQELELLRAIITSLPLEETIKWGAPTYVYKGKNIVGLAAFKNYCGLWFFQGALLKDEQKVFINAQEGKTKAMLQWRFYSIEDINAEFIKTYVLEAIENVKLGKEIKADRFKKEVTIPDELAEKLSENEELNSKFETFTNSKQREFCEYISSAKRASTKQTRLEKIIPMILNGLGLYDKYKNC
ncbi:hypothetical protein BW723_15325 [Polaribacter reichenbachii]|uniref:YdhG-like domain-containing protein n=2 Tax=Polaribacter reichenbachii TaxID=996801 RepID=A0A1B8U5D9_9FLAO|nr:DUF1801 domain-containing protein [Polaribacter reichenbachii]APZ47570.1 hypothetical protein BW723_15325 [Polaribacter reichenbachii]AUC18210.1 hypothetical protein BTO17_05770 [Polaribacter reichenbachii]OBY67077.1 hypothetical protein LPB301_04465 [Polaribacter reichenbachii]